MRNKKEKLLDPFSKFKQKQEELSIDNDKTIETIMPPYKMNQFPQIYKNKKYISLSNLKDKPRYQDRFSEAFDKLIIDINETSQS